MEMNVKDDVGQSLILEEVFRIKKVLDSYEDGSESMLLDSLRSLQSMDISMDTLKVTMIGKSVSGVRKHGSKQIRHLVRNLIQRWRRVVDEWVIATAAIPESTTPQSPKTAVVEEEEAAEEEEGLPCPPWVEEAVLFTSTAPMDLSHFLEGLDFNAEFEKNPEMCIKPSVWNEACRPVVAPRKVKIDKAKKQEVVIMKKQASAVPKPKTPSVFEPKLPRHRLESPHKSSSILPKRAVPAHQNNTKIPDAEDSFEAAKRRMQERYQEVANAKRQRRVQVMELKDIPQQLVPKSQRAKPAGNRTSCRQASGN